MQQDIRNLFKNYTEESRQLSVNHSDKFEKLLRKELHQKGGESKKPSYVR